MIFARFFTICPIHPLVYITAAFSLGIVTKYSCPMKLMFFVSFLLLILIGIGCYFFKRNNVSLFLTILAFFSGSILIEKQLHEHEKVFTITNKKPCTIRGKIIGITNLEDSRSKQSTLITSEFIYIDNKTYPFDKVIQIYTSFRNNFQIEDTIELQNISIIKQKNGSFDSYLIKENIAASLFITNKKDLVLLHHPQYSFWRWFYHIRQNLLDNCRKKLSDQTFALFSSIFLGNRIAGKKEMETPKESCKTWGISHYLARSGLHLVIFIFAWHLLLSFLPIPFYIKHLCIILLCFLYFTLSWSSISFIRAFVTFIFYKICLLLGLPINSFYLLTLVCFLVLLFNPMQLFFLDFQLSFGLTFALSWFNQIQYQRKFQIDANY